MWRRKRPGTPEGLYDKALDALASLKTTVYVALAVFIVALYFQNQRIESQSESQSDEIRLLQVRVKNLEKDRHNHKE